MDIYRYIDSYKDYIIISVIIAIHSILSIWWVLKDTRPPAWDQSVHMVYALAYFRGYDLVFTSAFYPPGLHLSISPLFTLFGESFNTACFINIFFLAILIVSVYEIGKTLFNREAGLYSALIISFVPMLIMFQRDFLLDFALVSIVALNLYLLLKTNNFHSLNYSLLFGASAGFAILIKWTAIFFILVPFAWVVFQSLKEEKRCSYCDKVVKKKGITNNFYCFCSEGHKKKFKEESKFVLTKQHNLFFSLIAFIVAAGWWYVPNSTNVVNNLLSGQKYWGAIEGDPTGISGFWYYIEAIGIQTCLFISLLIVVGMVFFFIKAEKDKKILIGTSILLPFLVFLITANKDVRYTLPLLIFFVLTTGFMLSSLKRKEIKVIVISAILIIGTIQTSTLTFGCPSFDVPNYVYPQSNAPKQENWRAEEIVNSLPQGSRVLILYNNYHMNWRTLQYYEFLNNKQIRIDGYEAIIRAGRKVTDYEFVLCVEEDISITNEQISQIATANRIFQAQISEFEEIRRFILPNGKELIIYGKTKV